MEYDLDKLRKNLLFVYEGYLERPNDIDIMDFAGVLYNRYSDLDSILKPEFALAIRNLVDVSFDTDSSISKVYLEKIISSLKNNNNLPLKK